MSDGKALGVGKRRMREDGRGEGWVYESSEKWREIRRKWVKRENCIKYFGWVESSLPVREVKMLGALSVGFPTIKCLTTQKWNIFFCKYTREKGAREGVSVRKFGEMKGGGGG